MENFAYQELDEKSPPPPTNALPVPDNAEPDLELEPEPGNPHDERRTSYLDASMAPDYHVSDGHYIPSIDSRDHAARLVDDLTLLQAERAVTNEKYDLSTIRSPTDDPERDDVFNQRPPTPTASRPLEAPSRLRKAYERVRHLPRILRYFLYSLPIATILLAPILLGIFTEQGSKTAIGGPGGVQLLWFGIWLEVVWLSLWAARIATSVMPYALGLGAKITGSGNYSKWRDIGRQIELPLGLFLWMLAVLVSFLPIVNNHKIPARVPDEANTEFPPIQWIDVMNTVIIALFVLAILNFVEKMLIQWIATSFHMRTYSSRIAVNKQSIAYLVYLYEHSKDKLVSEEAVMGNQVGSGMRTPLGLIANNAREVATKIGDITNRVAGDFTGRQVKPRNHPRKVVSELLRTSHSSQVLARRLFHTYAQNGSCALKPGDLNQAFPTPEDAEAAFLVFDRDLNGDVCMDELEAFVDEVHREKKAIAASMKDLDSVIRKLDRVFFVIIFVISVIVFISTISPYTAAALASAGTAVLGLAWVLQATAQEFLQSMIFVFVKHPFDVGDRVTVYGNTGSTLQGDDYYVTEISLLYTEFKKMQGHIVQAPNSVLNNLFILNHRRSGPLSDSFALVLKFGTSASVITELEARMTEYVQANKRDFGSQIITELVSFQETRSMTLNFICFHKSSYQNELLRLTRHNKFALELMNQMVALGIEQPRTLLQVSGKDFPVYQTQVAPPAYPDRRPSAIDPSLLTATRRRANSRASGTDDVYQDVFGSRKGHNKTISVNQLPPAIHEELVPPPTGVDAKSINTLEHYPSNGTGKASNSRGLFSRSVGTLRRQSRVQPPDRAGERDRDMV